MGINTKCNFRDPVPTEFTRSLLIGTIANLSHNRGDRDLHSMEIGQHTKENLNPGRDQRFYKFCQPFFNFFIKTSKTPISAGVTPDTRLAWPTV